LPPSEGDPVGALDSASVGGTGAFVVGARVGKVVGPSVPLLPPSEGDPVGLLERFVGPSVSLLPPSEGDPVGDDELEEDGAALDAEEGAELGVLFGATLLLLSLFLLFSLFVGPSVSLFPPAEGAVLEGAVLGWLDEDGAELNFFSLFLLFSLFDSLLDFLVSRISSPIPLRRSRSGRGKSRSK